MSIEYICQSLTSFSYIFPSCADIDFVKTDWILINQFGSIGFSFGSVTNFLYFDNKNDYRPCILSNLGKRRTQDHDTNRILGRLPYRSRGWTKEALDLVLESRNAT